MKRNSKRNRNINRNLRNLRNILLISGGSLLALGGSASGAVKTWTGTTDGAFNTGTNWGGAIPATGDSFVFTSATGLGGTTLNNNLTSAAFSVAGITFNAGSPAYTINGNTFVLTGNVANNSTALQTINTAFSMTAGRNFTTTAGGGDLTLGGNISGTGGAVTKLGAGTLILSGTNSHTGNTLVSAGSLIISGSHSGVGTVAVSSGASMAISGTYSGTGAITLNGGTLDLGNGTATGTLASTVLTFNGGAFNYTRTGGANTKTFTTTNINAGASSTVSAIAGNILNLGTVVRANGGTMDFSSVGAGIVATTTANVGGIMSGFTFGDTWAVGNGAGVAISGLGTYTLSSVAGTTAANYTGNNIDVDNSEPVLSAAITANSLRFSAAAANTLTLTGVNNTITTGGILVGSGVGSNLSTITGGTLRGATNRDLLIVQNNTSGGLTISSDIVNNTSTSVTKSGAGLLTLSGNNTFTGGVLINAGKLTVGSAGALNSTAGSENAVTFGAGSTGTFGLGGTGVVIRSLDSNANNVGTPVVENASGSNAILTIGNSAGASGTFAGIIQNGTGVGTLALVKAGGGTQTLSGANTYSGGTTINAGILSITGTANTDVNAVLGNTSGGITLNGGRLSLAGVNVSSARSVTVNGTGSSMFVNRNNNFTTSGDLTGSGAITFVAAGGGGSASLYRFTSASNNFTGAMSVEADVRFSSLSDEAGDGGITLNGGGSIGWEGGAKTFDDRQFILAGSGQINNLNLNTGALTIASDIGFSGAGTRSLTLAANLGSQLTLSGDITDNGGSATSLTITGAIGGGTSNGGTVALSGTNTYTGTTTLTTNSGGGFSLPNTTIFQGEQSLSSFTSVILNRGNNGLHTIKFLDDAGGVNNSTVTWGNNFTSNDATAVTLFVGNNNTTNGGNSAGSTTGGTMALGNYTFGTAGTSGAITVEGTNGYGLSIANLVGNASSTTAVTYTLTPNSAPLTIAGTVTMGAGNASNSPTLVLAGTATGNFINGAISNPSSGLGTRVTKSGSSTWTLQGTNTYTGLTTVSGGVLVLDSANALPGGIATTGGTSALTFNGGVIGLSDGDFTRSLGAAGIVTAVNFTGAGGWAAYDADRIVNLGGATGTVTWATASTGFNGQTLILGASTATNKVTLQNGLDLTNAARTVQVDNGSASVDGEISGVISGIAGGALTKTGAGTLRLSNTNSYIGITTITAGTLEASVLDNGAANSSIGASAATANQLLLADGTTFRYVGAANATTNRAFTINGTVAGQGATIESSGAGTLSFNTPGTALAFGTNNQTRTLTLGGTNAGANTFGKILANNGSGATSLVKSGTGTWVLNQANTYGGTTTISAGTLSAGNVVVSGGSSHLGSAASAVILGSAGAQGTLSYTGNNATYIRGFTIGGAGGGRLDVTTSGQTLIVNTGNVTGTGLFTVGGAGNTTINSNLTHTGGLTKTGNGKLTLSGTNTYNGVTDVDAGTLLINGSNTGGGAINVDLGATLGGTGSTTSTLNVSGVLSPGASIATLESGELNLLTGSTFEYEVDSSVANSVGADLQKVTGDLNLTGTVTLTLADLAAVDVSFAAGTTFSLINYTGNWNGGFFTFSGNQLTNNEQFTAGLNTWSITYNSATGGSNYSVEYFGGSDGFVNIVAVAIPEPSTAILCGLGLLGLLRRRR